MTTPIDVDSPELRLFAQFAGVAPAKLAAAVNDPAHFAHHLDADELIRLGDGCFRLAAFGLRCEAAIDTFTAYTKGLLDANGAS